MKKLLYVGEDIKLPSSGGQYVNYRNLQVLRKIFGESFFITHIQSCGVFYTFYNSFWGYLSGLNKEKVKAILLQIKNQDIKIVFLSSSKLGRLASIIKKVYPQVEIYVFFHNIEKYYAKEEFRINKSLKNFYLKELFTYNESLACKYGDKLIVLNERDREQLSAFYHRSADLVLPITFMDLYSKEERLRSKNGKETFTLLFVGSAFFANIEGVNWFVKNVFPQLDECKLEIVGKGMEQVFNSSENINVTGFVEDLSTYYYKCDVVISPIFSGSGMKTKTAEALMYGCPIIGTKEAFEGYDLDFERIGGCVNSVQAMVDAIQKMQHDKFLLEQCANYARQIFMQKYAIEITERQLLSFVE